MQSWLLILIFSSFWCTAILLSSNPSFGFNLTSIRIDDNFISNAMKLVPFHNLLQCYYWCFHNQIIQPIGHLSLLVICPTNPISRLNKWRWRQWKKFIETLKIKNEVQHLAEQTFTAIHYPDVVIREALSIKLNLEESRVSVSFPLNGANYLKFH